MKLRVKLIILFVLSIISIIFVYNDYFLYSTPIVKIINIEEEKHDSIKDEYYNQIITGIIQNGKYKGNIIEVSNKTSKSGVYDEQIHKNTEIFVELSNDGTRVNSISGIKRDKYLVILLVIFLDLLLIVSNKKGFKSLLSLFINIIITIISIIIFQNNYKSINILLLYLLVAIIFIILSLYITNGKSKKTLSAIISSILSLFVSFTLSFLIIKLFGKDITIWTMEYIEVIYDYENFFYVSILLCGLGAIMDISITISSALNELIKKDPKIEVSSLINSGKEIAKDIVGTMNHVMLYTCYSSIIPLVFLALRNGMILANAISFYGNLELITVLTTCISIVIAIPISLYTSIFILKEVRK